MRSVIFCNNRFHNLKKYQKLSKRNSSNLNKWNTVVGLEVHAQLNTVTKLFSGAENKFGGLVNNSVSYFDAAIPGTLPVLNRRCVELGVMTALALSCRVNEVSYFDRKHYFYADLPAGYQITQQRAPLASNGVINFQVYTPGIHKKPYQKSSIIKQIQLEQDSGKSLHDEMLGRSLVDLNRAGAPLMELVFEPDLKDGEEAAALIRELLLIVERLGSCSGRMEEGALRVDANVSVNKIGEPFGVRTEIKNIGSVRGVAGAIKYELERQISVLESGGHITNQTMAWDAESKVTVPMRDKEVVQDYRYMPEPNLPPLRLNLKDKTYDPNVISVPKIQENIPELPEESRSNLIKLHNLKPESAIILVNEPKLYKYFQDLVSKTNDANKLANFLINDLLTVLNKSKIDLISCELNSHHLAEVVELLFSKKINLETCRSLLEKLLTVTDKNVMKIVKENNWLLVTDSLEIETVCMSIIRDNPKLVEQYKNGKSKVFKALVGLVAKNSRNKYDMALVTRIMEDLLKK